MFVKSRISKLLKNLMGEKSFLKFKRGVYFFIGLFEFEMDYTNKYDVIFFNEMPIHLEQIQLVITNIINHYDLRILVLNTFKNLDNKYHNSKEFFYSKTYASLLFMKSRMIYTPVSGFSTEFVNKNIILIHQIHSLIGLDNVYGIGAFNSFDYIICATQHQIENFRIWRSLNSNLEGVVLIPGGYPKLDFVAKKFNEVDAIDNNDVVIYAPTMIYSVNESFASLRTYGRQIISTVLDSGLNLVFRPHPVSMNNKVDSDIIEGLINDFCHYKRFKVDFSTSYFDTYANSSLMITDVSGTGITYSLGFLKPTIYFVKQENVSGIDPIIKKMDSLGISKLVFGIEGLDNDLKNMIDKNYKDLLMDSRDKLIFNFSYSSDYIAKSLYDILISNHHEDWLIL